MIKRKHKYYVLIFIFVLIIVLGCFKTIAKNNSPYSLAVFKKQDHWEYIISKNNKPYIHQTSMPAIQGIIYFNDSTSALTVGNKVLEKLQKGYSPTISITELESLKIN